MIVKLGLFALTISCLIMASNVETEVISAADTHVDSGGLKRGLSERSSTSSVSEPDHKKPNIGSKIVIQELKEEDMPAEEASPGDWSKFLFKQMKILNSNFQQLVERSEFVSKQAKEAIEHNKQTTKLIADITQSVTVMSNENANLKKENEELKGNLLKLECRQRRDNLVFEGFDEVRGERDVDCYWKLANAISYIPDIYDPYSVKISRCHRVGPYKKGQKRPIVAHFHWFGDRQRIYKNKRYLPRGIYIHEDFPNEIEERRSALKPILQAALQKEKYKNRVYLTVDKLIVNKKAFTIRPRNNLHELPPDLNPEILAERENNQTLVFFGQGSKLSNFHPAPFSVNNTKYTCSEQFIQSSKAGLFGDEYTQQRIMSAKSPRVMKSLGSRIRNFDKKAWHESAPQIARDAVLNKFSQNETLKQKLLSTGDKILAEASREELWGTGVGLHEAGCLDMQTWTGRGIMGDALLYVRDILKHQ